MNDLSKFSFFRNVGGKLKLLLQYLPVKFGIKKWFYFSDSQTCEQGLYLPYDLLLSIEKEVDIVITYPHFLERNKKNAFIKLAEKLSKTNTVFIHEVLVEAGGGADFATTFDMVRQTAKFIYDYFQPFINTAGNALTVYEIVNMIYQKKNRNLIIKNQFTIKRILNGIRYNYIFDRLKPNVAIEASKAVPKEGKDNSNRKVYRDIYMRFNSKKKVWLKFDDREIV